MLDAQWLPACARRDRRGHILRTIPVIVDHLRITITVSIEPMGHVAQRIPLRRVLKVQGDRVVVYHIRELGRDARQATAVCTRTVACSSWKQERWTTVVGEGSSARE